METKRPDAAPPPSDAAPVAWRVEVEKEGDEIIGPVRLVTGPGESWEIQGVEEDCYEDEAWAKLLCERHNATLYAHPADAPPEVTEEMVEVLRRIRDYATAGYRNTASMELALDGIFKAADDALAAAQKGG